MAKTALGQQHNPFSTIASAMVRTGMKDKHVYDASGIPRMTWYRNKESGRLTLEQLRAIDDVIDFTDSELIELIRGRQ